MGEALKVLLAEDVPAEKAAALLELDVSEVRRLVKAPRVEVDEPQPGREAEAEAEAEATVSVLPDAAGGECAARRAG